ncbi:hypothetical protein B0O99DRAFT_740136 [Bisporella sp. PMI_857]|nr:hypothetical protein B0O99DRAFT_740136 [Bisporella sp. PMI_857]
MARKKATYNPPQSVKNNITSTVKASANAFTSSTSKSTPPTCPNCQQRLPVMSITDFRDHVASCSSNTANNATSSSSLSTPPISPPQPDDNSVPELVEDIEQESITVANPATPTEQIEPEVVQEHVTIVESALPTEETSQEASNIFSDAIRPYVKDAIDHYDEEEEPSTKVDLPKIISEKLEAGVSEAMRNPVGYDEITNDDASEEKEGFDGAAETLSQGMSVALIKPSKNKLPLNPKLAFPTLTHPDVFETYLDDLEELTYEEVYERTARVSDCLATWQAEFDEAQQEIEDYETLVKVEKTRAEEEEKERIERLRLREDAAREKIARAFAVPLKLKGDKWSDWREQYELNNPDAVEIIKHLDNIHNPIFMAQVNKRLRIASAKESVPAYDNVPLPVYKPTKDEQMVEKKKMGRLMDPNKFDDMKQADVCGFEYSSHVKHIQAQPLGDDTRRRVREVVQAPNGEVQIVASEAGTPSGRRTRAPRNTTKRAYGEVSLSAQESENEELPAKRARKPKVVDDSIESGKAAKEPKEPSRFPSGKRIGRPPAALKAKQNIQDTPAMKSPAMRTLTVRSPAPESPAAKSLIGSLQDFLYGGEVNGNGTNSLNASRANTPRELDSSQEAQLHDAAESLFNQTVADTEPVITKKKHAGGRPKKYVAESSSLSNILATADEIGGLAKPRNRGGRPRKNTAIKLETASNDNDVQLGEENAILQSTEQEDGFHEQGSQSSGGSKRKRNTVDTDDSPLVVDSAPQDIDDVAAKKRKGRVYKETPEELRVNVPEARSKRKRESAEPGAVLQDREVEIKKPKRVAGKKKPKLYEEDLSGVDESILTPEELAEHRKKLAKQSKSIKLRDSLAARWASGKMDKAQETRRRNNALKKAAKEEIAALENAELSEAPAIPTPTEEASTPAAIENEVVYTPAAVDMSTQYALPAESLSSVRPKQALRIVTAPKSATKRAKPAPPPPRPASTRAKKAPKPIGGFDGVEDDESETAPVMERKISEYERFQALASPGNGVELGKRARKSTQSFNAWDDDDDEFPDEIDEPSEDDDYSFD